jgi:Rrf2 family transcriptional regulator, iron-sulfur cluster assembly transcription factor
MLSSTCKYALRAVIYLAALEYDNKDIAKTGIKKISRDLEIPMPFLGKILQTLARHKVLSSTKGPNGGFGLGRPSHEIALMDIVEIIDGTDFFKQCVIGVKYCSELENPCALHSRYSKYREELKELFEKETVGDLVEDVKSGKQKINI